MRKDAIIPGRSAELLSFPTSIKQNVTKVIGGNIMEYWNDDANEGHGDNRRVKGNDEGPYIVPIQIRRKENLTETDLDENNKLTFGSTMKGIEIYNESTTNSLTYTINDIAITLEAGDSDQAYYDKFTEVTITGISPDFTVIGLS